LVRFVRVLARHLRVWSRGSAEVSVQIPAEFDGMALIPVKITLVK
jgi:hypothetical protein